MGLCTQCESDRLHSSVADTRAQEAAFTVWSVVCLAVVRWLLFALTLQVNLILYGQDCVRRT